MGDLIPFRGMDGNSSITPRTLNKIKEFFAGTLTCFPFYVLQDMQREGCCPAGLTLAQLLAGTEVTEGQGLRIAQYLRDHDYLSVPRSAIVAAAQEALAH